jgi:hypothetical protein
MKKAEDFRKAFGPVTPGFELAAKETIRELRAKETQKKRRTAGDWLRYRRPVLAMAIVKTWMSTDAFTEEKYTRRRDKVADIDREHTVAVQ